MCGSRSSGRGERERFWVCGWRRLSQLPQPYPHRRIAFLFFGKRRWSSRRFGFRLFFVCSFFLGVPGFGHPGTATRCRFSRRELRTQISQLNDFRNRPCRIGHATTFLRFGVAVCVPAVAATLPPPQIDFCGDASPLLPLRPPLHKLFNFSKTLARARCIGNGTVLRQFLIFIIAPFSRSL